MRRALEDPSDLMRQKRTRSSSMVGIWRLNNSLRKEQIFYEPLITGEGVLLQMNFFLLITFKVVELIFKRILMLVYHQGLVKIYANFLRRIILLQNLI
jgi:hypothetical protein